MVTVTETSLMASRIFVLSYCGSFMVILTLAVHIEISFSVLGQSEYEWSFETSNNFKLKNPTLLAPDLRCKKGVSVENSGKFSESMLVLIEN